MQCCYGYYKVDASRGYNVRPQTKQTGSVVNADSSCVVEVTDIEEDVAEKQQCGTLPSKDQIALKFNPLGADVARTLCTKCDMEFEKQAVETLTVSGSLGVVCRTKKV